MAWNITQESGYATALENEWLKRMKTLRFRTEHLDGLQKLPEEKVVSEFWKAAPHWADQRKSIERVEKFLFDLQRAEKYTAHAGCMTAWGEQVHKKPSCFHGFFKIENLPKIVDRRENTITSNPSFRPDSSFEALNAYLAIDPLGCLGQPSLLSQNWLAGLSDERNRDAATVAIFSAFYRYGDQQDRHGPYNPNRPRSGRTGYALHMLDLISESAGVPFTDIIKSLPQTKKAASAVNRYYSEVVAYRASTSGESLPYFLNNLYTVMRASGLFELALQAKLFSTAAHAKVMQNTFRGIDAATYYNWFIESEFAALSEIKAVINPEYIDADNLAGMHEKGFAVPYLKSLHEDDLMAVIGRGIVLPKYLSRASDRGKLLEVDLGM